MTHGETTELLKQSRRERDRAVRLCAELRVVVAQSLVTLWHSRANRGECTGGTGTGQGAARAERAKRNRETVVHTPSGAR